MVHLLKWVKNKPQVVLHQVLQRRIIVNANSTTHSGGYPKSVQFAGGIGVQFALEYAAGVMRQILQPVTEPFIRDCFTNQPVRNDCFFARSPPRLLVAGRIAAPHLTVDPLGQVDFHEGLIGNIHAVGQKL